MSWKKHFRVIAPNSAMLAQQSDGNGAGQGTTSKLGSFLPEVYAGHPNRIQRYYQYDDMGRDGDIDAALDIIANFCTQSEEQNDQPFLIHFHEEGNETEVTMLKTLLQQWVKLNTFKNRLWFMFRETCKKGDAFFLRDPETFEWDWLDSYMVEGVQVDPERGKEPDEYLVRGLDLNRVAKYATVVADPNQYRMGPGMNGIGASRTSGAVSSAPSQFALAGNASGYGQSHNQELQNQITVVKAEHVVHLSMSAGLDINWPFGGSILESSFKTYKQKELIEDAVLIYRVSRAPERLVFKIDVGDMPATRAKAVLEQFKNELYQRRIPNRSGGGSSVMDAAYNPISINDNYYFAQTAEGRGSSVETLPGGTALGEIGDLNSFTRKLLRSLKIPSTYMPMGEEDAGASYQDGKLGAALIQEFQFNKYCMRLQGLLAPKFDEEFKRYIKQVGAVLESSMFELRFNPPQNFTKYRQMEIDNQQVAVYQSVADNRKLSERFKLKRFLNLTDEEILENERMWAEENPAKIKKQTGATPAEATPPGDFSSVGLHDTGDEFPMEPPGEEGDLGPDGGGGDPAADGGGDPGAAGGDMGGGAPPGGGGLPPPPAGP